MAKIKLEMEHGIMYECPNCAGTVEMGQDYCQDCGEPLEWVEDGNASELADEWDRVTQVLKGCRYDLGRIPIVVSRDKRNRR